MKVKELIEILQQVDGELPVGTYANNHSYFSDERADGKSHGELKISICNVGLCELNEGGKRFGEVEHLLIGNFHGNPNASKWEIVKELN